LSAKLGVSPATHLDMSPKMSPDAAIIASQPYMSPVWSPGAAHQVREKSYRLLERIWNEQGGAASCVCKYPNQKLSNDYYSTSWNLAELRRV
jgi:hypothetical protein